MNEWAQTVQMVYNKNKHRPGYKLKNAMRDAKKVYKKTKKHHQKFGKTKRFGRHKRHYGGGDGDSDSDSGSDSGSDTVSSSPEVVEETETETVEMEGGRRRRHRTRRHRGGRRTRHRTRRHRRR